MPPRRASFLTAATQGEIMSCKPLTITPGPFEPVTPVRRGTDRVYALPGTSSLLMSPIGHKATGIRYGVTFRTRGGDTGLGETMSDDVYVYKSKGGSVFLMWSEKGGQAHGLGFYRTDTGVYIAGSSHPVTKNWTITATATATGFKVTGVPSAFGSYPIEPPSYRLAPGGVTTFPGSIVGGEPARRTFRITNPSKACLEVKALTLKQRYPAFSVKSPSTYPQRVAPGKMLDVEVEFAPPRRGDFAAALVVETNATSHAPAPECRGRGLIRQLSVAPRPLAFGLVGIRTSKARTLNLANTGDVPLRVTVASSASASPFAWSKLDTPLTPGSNALLRTTFAPTTTGGATETITVGNTSDASEKRVETRVEVTGAGVIYADPGLWRRWLRHRVLIITGLTMVAGVWMIIGYWKWV